MSRRDTIIIAVLVNAALLMILFATAMRSEHPKAESTESRNANLVDLAAQQPVEMPAVENILNEYISSVPTLVESGQESIVTLDETELSLAVAPVEIVEPVPQVAAVEEVTAAPPKAEEKFVNVTVKKGDFLEKIAKANNTTVAAIMDANRMSSTQLKIGQVLKIPLGEGKKSTQKSATAASSKPSSLSEGDYYIVKEGDSPWLIASRNKIKLDDLLRLNGLDEQKAKRLRPGDKLKIR